MTITTTTATMSKPPDTFLCVVVVLTSLFVVSRGWFRFLTFKCPEVGLGFSLLGVQRLDSNFHFYVSRGWFRIFIFWWDQNSDATTLAFLITNIWRWEHPALLSNPGPNFGGDSMRTTCFKKRINTTGLEYPVQQFRFWVFKMCTNKKTTNTDRTIDDRRPRSPWRNLWTLFVCCRRVHFNFSCVQRLV